MSGKHYVVASFNGKQIAELRELKHLRAGRSGARETAPRQPVAEADVQATLPHLSRHL